MGRLPNPTGQDADISRGSRGGGIDPASPAGMREMVKYLLQGKNYRLLSEREVTRRLISRLVGVIEFAESAANQFGENWPTKLSKKIATDNLNASERETLIWLCGMAHKTAVNHGVSDTENLKRHFAETTGVVSEALGPAAGKKAGMATMLMMGGSAMLFVRGSMKSKVGKRLEGAFLRSCFALLGLKPEHYKVGVPADGTVVREVDAEVSCFERFIMRFELGLIERGNPEIINDKVTRVGRGNVVIFDRAGGAASIWENAENHGVHLVQIRNNHPLTHIYDLMAKHKTKEGVTLKKPPDDGEGIIRAVDDLPDNVFQQDVAPR